MKMQFGDMQYQLLKIWSLNERRYHLRDANFFSEIGTLQSSEIDGSSDLLQHFFFQNWKKKNNQVQNKDQIVITNIIQPRAQPPQSDVVSQKSALYLWSNSVARFMW